MEILRSDQPSSKRATIDKPRSIMIKDCVTSNLCANRAGRTSSLEFWPRGHEHELGAIEDADGQNLGFALKTTQELRILHALSRRSKVYDNDGVIGNIFSLRQIPCPDVIGQNLDA